MPYNERMPVLLEPHEYARWLHGSIKDVIAIQFRPPPPSDRFTVEHTDDLWRSGKMPPTAQPQASLRRWLLEPPFHDRMTAMCNLNTERHSAHAVADHIGVELDKQELNIQNGKAEVRTREGKDEE